MEQHPIWKIGLFLKLDKDRAICVECNAALKLSNRSPKSLIVHLNSTKHKHSNYAEIFQQLLVQREEASHIGLRGWMGAANLETAQFVAGKYVANGFEGP
jgi:hypothetical protein